MVKIGINGFGRIGKQFFLACLEDSVDWDFVINDIASPQYLVYSLKHDSVHPSIKENIEFDGRTLTIGKRKIKLYNYASPEHIPWKEEKVDLVVDCSGMFTKKEDAMKHIKAGAKRVLISAPAEDADCTIVCGVNDNALKKDKKIVSAASCTTNCVTPMLKVLHDKFGIKHAYFVTNHAYTATQKLIDGFDKKDFRRGRAAAQNIVPSTSGASKSVVEALPALKGKLEGYALRVPVINGSMTSVFAVLNKKVTKEQLNAAFKKEASSSMKDILSYNEDEIVSSDVIHNKASCIFDSTLTFANENHVSIAGWYDNEWGYSNRLVDVVKSML